MPRRFSPSFLALIGLLGFFIISPWTVPIMQAQVLCGTEESLWHGVGGDFRLLWAAAQQTAQGHADKVYDKDAQYEAAQLAKHPRQSHPEAFFYPPQTLLLLQYFAGDYHTALVRFSAVSFGCVVVAALWAFGAPLITLPLLLGFGGFWLSLMFGQFSTLLTAFYLAAYAFYLRRPTTSGVAFAFAAMKPHLALLVPPFLLLQGRLRALGMAVLFSLFLLGLTAFAFGPDVLLAAPRAMTAATDRLMQATDTQSLNLLSLYGSLYRAGVPPLIGLGLQMMLSFAVMVLAGALAAKKDQAPLAFAGLITAQLLIFPHLFVYDLVLMIAPLLILVAHMQKVGWQKADMVLLPAVYFSSFASFGLVHATNLPLIPALLFLLLLRIRQLAEAPQSR